MDMLSRENLCGGNADGLTVFENLCTGGDVGNGHFVINGNIVCGADSYGIDLNGVAPGNRGTAGNHIVDGGAVDHVGDKHGNSPFSPGYFLFSL